MIVLLTIGSEEKSAKNIGFKTIKTLNNIDEYKDDIIIRWGNSWKYWSVSKCDYRDFPNTINKWSAIRANCEKDKALEKLSKVVNTPRMYKVGQTVPDGKFVVYRPTEHTCGKGFQVKQGPFKIEDGCYATEFVDTDNELRVWYCNSNVVLAWRVRMKKNKVNKDGYKCRSEWGYQFTSASLKLKDQVAAAFKHLGLEFGAADILVPSPGKYYFLELNTAPTIDHWRLEEFFKNNLNELIEERFGSRLERLAA